MNASSRNKISNKKWSEKILKKIKSEKIALDHPKGKERFDQVIRNSLKKNK